MKHDPILLSVNKNIAVMTLNRPDKRNSMDSELLPAFKETIARIKLNADLRCLVISGTGRNFCGGADFNNFESGISQPKSLLPNERLLSFYQPFLDLQQVKIPVIAAMNGHAIGGGLGLMLMCDLRIANKTAKYGANFAKLGLHSGMAISYVLPRIIGLPRANELLFTGRLIDGGEANAIGLVNYAETEDRVLPKSMELAEEIASCAPLAVQMIKNSIYRGLDWNPTAAADMESHCQSRTFETEDAKEGIAALLEKRDPVFKGK